MAKKSTIVRSIQFLAPVTSAVSPPLAGLWLQRLFTTPIRHRVPDRERDWVQSARRSSLAFNGGSLAIYEWGHGPRILLVHGWSGRATQLGAFVQPLVEQGFSVLAFDAPGHGGASGSRSALPEFAFAMERVLERFGDVHGIIAHSMGTAATSFVLTRGASAKRLAYIAPPENPGNYLFRAARFLNFPDSIAPRAQRHIEEKYGVLFESARGIHLAPQIDTPLLIVHDEKDSDVPFAEGQRLADAWQGSTLHRTQGLGHTRILRDPDVVQRVVGFIAQ